MKCFAAALHGIIVASLLVSPTGIAHAQAPAAYTDEVTRWESPNQLWRAELRLSIPAPSAQNIYSTTLTLTAPKLGRTFTFKSGPRPFGLGYDRPQIRHWTRDGRFVYVTNEAVPDGCAGLYQGGDLQQIDLRTGRLRTIRKTHYGALAFAPDERKFAAYGQNGLAVEPLVSSQAARRVRLPQSFDAVDSIGMMAWSPDNRWLAVTIGRDLCMAVMPGTPPKLRAGLVDTRAATPTLITIDADRDLIVEGWSGADAVLLRDPYDAQWRYDLRKRELKRAGGAIFPMAAGTQWIYRERRYDGFNANVIMTATRISTHTLDASTTVFPAFAVLTMQVEWSPEMLESVRGSYPVSTSLQAASKNRYEVRTSRSGGSWWLAQAWDSYGDAPSLNDYLTLPLRMRLPTPRSWCLMAANCVPEVAASALKEFEVSGLTFANCTQLDYTIGGLVHRDIFCPGVGFVLSESHHNGTPSGIRRELIDFRPNARG